MKFCFIHPVFGSQFYPLAAHLAEQPEHEVLFLCSADHGKEGMRNLGRDFAPTPRMQVQTFNYHSGRKHHADPLLQRILDESYQGMEVFRTLRAMKKQGYAPDFILCHNYWGAALYLKDIYPEVPKIVYSEYHSTPEHVAACLKPGAKLPDSNKLYLRTGQANSLISLDAADVILTPTEFQKSTHPAYLHSKIKVIHDGIDTDFFAPNHEVQAIGIAGRKIAKPEHKIITYVSRNFESYRGFESFVKAAAIVQQQCHEAVFLVGGGTGGGGYGGQCGPDYVKSVLADTPELDLRRFLFMGVLNHADYQQLLQLSDVHVYLTVPFVLSWSLLEAMATGCTIVASDTAPVKEVIKDGKNGLLADLYAPEAIAEQIVKAIQKPNPKLGEQARKTIEKHYSIGAVLPQFVQFFSKYK